MATLKDIRIARGLTQNDVANIIGSYASVVSNYEAGNTLPDLENMVILENHFQTRIEWPEPLTPAKKREVIQSLIELCERYPIEGVCEFAARVYRRKQAPESFINHYAAVSGTQSRELLLPLE